MGYLPQKKTTRTIQQADVAELHELGFDPGIDMPRTGSPQRRSQKQPNHQWAHNLIELALRGSLDVLPVVVVAADYTESARHRYRCHRSSLASIALEGRGQAAVVASDRTFLRPPGSAATPVLGLIAGLGSIPLAGCRALRLSFEH